MHAATKVNRYPTEGRQALAIKLAGTEGGIGCAKLTPQLLALADGEARTEQVAQLQLHMRAASVAGPASGRCSAIPP